MESQNPSLETNGDNSNVNEQGIIDLNDDVNDLKHEGKLNDLSNQY